MKHLVKNAFLSIVLGFIFLSGLAYGESSSTLKPIKVIDIEGGVALKESDETRIKFGL